MSRQPQDRPRERLMALGPAALSDAELVAIHLGTGIAGTPVEVLAGKLLDEWGGVAGLGRASIDELIRAPGVGPTKACRLLAAFALADRAQAPGAPAPISSAADIADFAHPRIGRSPVEEVLLIVLDAEHRVRRSLIVSRGGATGFQVPVREILSLVLRSGGAAFALAHNHPGGVAGPGSEDVEATARLRAAADQVGLLFLDHVAVGRNL